MHRPRGVTSLLSWRRCLAPVVLRWRHGDCGRRGFLQGHRTLLLLSDGLVAAVEGEGGQVGVGVEPEAATQLRRRFGKAVRARFGSGGGGSGGRRRLGREEGLGAEEVVLWVQVRPRAPIEATRGLLVSGHVGHVPEVVCEEEHGHEEKK